MSVIQFPPEVFYFLLFPIAAAMRADPSFSDCYSNYGNCLKDLGRFDDAIKAYLKAIELRPTFADAYGNLASVYKDSGHLDKAIQYYRTSLSLRVNMFANIYIFAGSLDFSIS